MFYSRTVIKVSAVGMFLASMAMSQTNSNSIDAVSSASGKFQLMGGEAFSTYAVVTWQDEYNNGSTHALKYGINSVDENSINLKPFSKNNDVVDTLPDLTPATQYVAEFVRTYEGNSHNASFTFTTPEEVVSVKAVSFTIAKSGITPGSVVFLYNQAGQKIADISSNEYVQMVSDKTRQRSVNISTGVYLAIWTDSQSKAMQSRRLVIRR
jgi:hypothetical protein